MVGLALCSPTLSLWGNEEGVVAEGTCPSSSGNTKTALIFTEKLTTAGFQTLPKAWCGADGTILKSEYISVGKERYPKGDSICGILKDEANKKAVEGSTCQTCLCSIKWKKKMGYVASCLSIIIAVKSKYL